MAAIAVGATSHYSDIGESAVMIVLEENAWLRIYSNINIRPPIVIEIIRDRGDGVPRARLQNSRLLRNISKSAVSIVVIEDVRVARKATRSAHDRYALPLTIVRIVSSGNLLWIQLDVVTHEEI